MCAVGLTVLIQLGLITGQIAGLALILSDLLGLNFGLLFFALNFPFYVFGWRKMGLRFTVKSLASVACLSVLTEIIPTALPLGAVDMLWGIIVFGIVTSIGLIAVFRHGGSIGGMTVLAVYLQRSGLAKAGHVQMAFDAALFAVAIWLYPWSIIVWSLAGAVILNMMIALNHRNDRYIAE